MVADVFDLFLLAIIWVVCGFFAYVAADSKGLESFSWLFAGFLFGPIALLALAAMNENSVELARRRLKAGTSKVCGACAEPVRARASRCPHCCTDFVEEDEVS